MSGLGGNGFISIGVNRILPHWLINQALCVSRLGSPFRGYRGEFVSCSGLVIAKVFRESRKKILNICHRSPRLANDRVGACI
jgi:hypothetical protein